MRANADGACPKNYDSDMKAIILLATLAACGGGDSDHDVVDCPLAWDSVTNGRCERACMGGPVCAPNDFACQSALPLCATTIGNCPADRVAMFEDQRGCCITDNSRERIVRWNACEGE